MRLAVLNETKNLIRIPKGSLADLNVTFQKPATESVPQRRVGRKSGKKTSIAGVSAVNIPREHLSL
jgi:hypothetical protein